MYRVAPAVLGKATRKAALPRIPKPKSEIRAWLVLGSHNVSKAAVRCLCIRVLCTSIFVVHHH